MIAALCALAVATPAPSERALEALAAVDLAEVERARTRAAEAGVAIDRGLWGYMHAASRLIRCLPLPPPPPGEPADVAGARALLRLEALRVERHRAEGAYGGDATLERMLELSRRWVVPEAREGAAWVVWPVSTERWPDEVVEPAVEPSVCGANMRAAGRDRGLDEARAAQAMIEGDARVPPVQRARVLLHALARGARLSATASVSAWLDGGEPAVVVAGAIRLARRAEALGQVREAALLYRRALEIEVRTDAEDGWARARLVGILDAPAEVLAVVRGAHAPRRADAAALALAEARALYALGDLESLERFGRAWLARRGPPDPLGFDAAIEDVLVVMALSRPHERAFAWVAALGPPGERDERLEKLALRALETGRIELAAFVYDELRRGAEAERARGGAPAVARLTRWLGGRARVEQARGDVEAFAAWVGELVHIATDEADRPLARTAPHRALAVLCQRALGPLTEAKADPSTAVFARVLVDAIDRLTEQTTRWSRTLSSHRPPLAALAGLAAAPVKGKRPPPPIRSVGVVTLPRLEQPLPAPDEPPPLPAVGTFWVHPGDDGQWREGPPWSPGP